MFLEPAFDRRTFVSAGVVHDQMQIQFAWSLLMDLLQETYKLLTTMARQALADDLAIQQPQRGKQGGGAVPFVIVALASGDAGPQRKQRGGSIQRLNLTLFIDREHQRFVWRVEVQTHHVAHLGDKMRVARQLESLHPVRLQAMLLPNPLHGHVRKSLSFGQRAGGPMRGRRRGGPQGRFHDALNPLCRQGFLASGARAILQ